MKKPKKQNSVMAWGIRNNDGRISLAVYKTKRDAKFNLFTDESRENIIRVKIVDVLE